VNDRRFLERVVALLGGAGVEIWIFGGWAEELLGLSDPREHADVDLLYVAEDWSGVDAFLVEMAEVTAKRFPHKRAFVLDGVLVELLLVQRDRDGYFSRFPAIDYRWPPDVVAEHGRLPVAGRESVVAYRNDHHVVTAKPQAAA
jgi:hypothetical protein